MTERNEWRKPGLSDEENAELDEWIAEMESPAFRHGQDVGHSYGLYEAQMEAILAYEAGDIDLWIEYIRPKSMEDWDAFHEKHGSREELKARWAEKPIDNDDKDN